jgi:asparaginyl-tRNA synthetase
MRPDAHLDHLLDHPWYRHLLHLLDVGAWGAHCFFRSRGATQALLPVTTGAISSPMGLGSDSMPVRATIDGSDVYLADSMQFMLELTARIEQRPTYYVMSSFRGEAADHRHLNQFFHVEVELPGGRDDAMEWAEALVRAMAGHLLSEAPDALEALGADLTRIAAFSAGETPFMRITHDEALALLVGDPGGWREEGGERVVTSHGERALCRRLGDFIWLTDMPRATVPFYQAVLPDRPDRTATADLLAGIGETLGLGERARTPDDVLANLAFCAVDPAAYGWYLEMKRRDPCRTAGFGLGLERFLMWCVGGRDIRDFCLLLRDAAGQGEP